MTSLLLSANLVLNCSRFPSDDSTEVSESSPTTARKHTAVKRISVHTGDLRCGPKEAAASPSLVIISLV